MAEFDKGARYLAKQNPHGFVAWLWRPAATPLRFHSWLDTRRLALPASGDHTCDTVAAFRLPDQPEPTHALVTDFKARSERGAVSQVLDYVVRLHLEPPPEMAAPLHLGRVVINLTGAPQESALSMVFPGLAACGWRFGVLQRTLLEESAAATLADILGGRTTRWLLPWIPLMHGGGHTAIIRGWQRAAQAEPNPEVRATLGSLALVFAELAKRGTVWQDGLRGWNVLKSKIVEEWREEARVEARLATCRETLQALLEERFGAVPRKWARRIQQTTDLARLKAALRQVVHIQSLDELQL